MALSAVITDPEKIEPAQKIQIACNAPDDGLLLADWLNALIYEMAVREMLFGKFEVKIDSGSLSAEVWGEKIDVEKHSPAVEVKAATYHALEVCQKDDKTWIAQCVVDV